MATTLQLLLLAAACALVAAEWSVVGSGWCQDENGAYTSDVQGVVGSGAKGEAKCRAACLARQPRCVAMSFDHSNGYCGLVGRTLTRADTNMALGLTNYWPYSGSDIITRTAVDANDVCTVYTPGEHRRPPARPPAHSVPHAPLRWEEIVRGGWAARVRGATAAARAAAGWVVATAASASETAPPRRHGPVLWAGAWLGCCPWPGAPPGAQALPTLRVARQIDCVLSVGPHS